MNIVELIQKYIAIRPSHGIHEYEYRIFEFTTSSRIHAGRSYQWSSTSLLTNTVAIEKSLTMTLQVLSTLYTKSLAFLESFVIPQAEADISQQYVILAII